MRKSIPPIEERVKKKSLLRKKTFKCSVIEYYADE